MTEGYKRNPNTKCVVCNKSIYRRPQQIQENKGRVFCGQVCYGTSCRKETPCVICGKLILSSLNKKTCSRACSNTQRAGIKYKINSPKDNFKSTCTLKISLQRNRGQNCERCGYGNFKILQVHHKDRNRNNNTLDNLELICPNCHCEEHYL